MKKIVILLFVLLLISSCSFSTKNDTIQDTKIKIENKNLPINNSLWEY